MGAVSDSFLEGSFGRTLARTCSFDLACATIEVADQGTRAIPGRELVEADLANSPHRQRWPTNPHQTPS